MAKLRVVAISAVAGAALMRPDAVVRLIRHLDRRGGITSRRGAGAYARLAFLASGLHHAVEDDAVAITAGRSATVVDLGPGPGDLLNALRRRMPTATLLGVEPSAAMRAIARERGVEELDGRAESLPLADGSVDLLVSTLSSHHWDDPVRAFREIGRVLAPSGEARIYDVRFAGFGATEVAQFAAAAGFRAVTVERRVLPLRVAVFRPYSLITVHA